MKLNLPKKIKAKRFLDNRGYFQECFKEKKFKFKPVFTAISCSKKKVIRGLHFQNKFKQKIFITVLVGKIFDVCIDIDFKSKNFSKIYTNTLQEGDMLYIPLNFAHGFAGMHKKNLIMYQFSDYHDKSSEVGIRHNDKELKIKWPYKNPILSEKDKKNISFEHFKINYSNK